MVYCGVSPRSLAHSLRSDACPSALQSGVGVWSLAQGRSTKIISMIKWIRTSRLSIKNSLSGVWGLERPAERLWCLASGVADRVWCVESGVAERVWCLESGVWSANTSGGSNTTNLEDAPNSRYPPPRTNLWSPGLPCGLPCDSSRDARRGFMNSRYP